MVEKAEYVVLFHRFLEEYDFLKCLDVTRTARSFDGVKDLRYSCRSDALWGSMATVHTFDRGAFPLKAELFN